MSQSSSPDLAYGFEPPKLTQYSVFLPNRVGMLLDLVEVFKGQAIELAGYSVVDASDYAAVRLVTSNGELARRLLTRHGLSFSEVEILAVELGGGKTLSELCESLVMAEVNIEYSYPLLVQPRGRAGVVVQTDDILLTAQILRRKLFTLLAENDFGDNASRSAPDAG